jgi:putative membrane protein
VTPFLLAAAHPLGGFQAQQAARWTWDPWGLAAVAPAAALYARGLSMLWGRGKKGLGVRRWQAGCYAAGVVVLAVALLSPLDAWSDFRFWVHMSQHELIMTVAAPLMVLGRPLYVCFWALPLGARRRARGVLATPRFKIAWSFASAPLFVLTLHAVVRWIWHIPALFEAAMASDALHALQHFSFFATAALFWWAISNGRYGRAGYGLGLLFVFVTAFHTSLLAALLTVAPEGFYPIYALQGLESSPELLEDQELGGLIMWVPSAVLLLVSALALFVAWLGEGERRARRADWVRARDVSTRRWQPPALQAPRS